MFMATDKNKQNTKRDAKSGKPQAKKASQNKKNPHAQPKSIKFEIFAICAIALCLYLLVCIYS